jgi:hypothetical protein
MDWLPQVGRIDAFAPFEAVDGRNRPVVIDSLTKLRQVERESEKMAANGEGQSLTWRMYSNDASNRHVNTHGPDPSETPSADAIKKFGPGLKRHGEIAPQTEFGPGVTEANTSVIRQEG